MTKHVIDAEAFSRIECNRCGVCCRRFTLGGHSGLHDGPLGLLEQYGKAEATGRQCGAFWPVSFLEFSGQLESQWDEDWERWVYSCGHLSHDSDGLSQCGIYDQRPRMCESFPAGKPVTRYDECAYNVELIDFVTVEGVVDRLY